MYFLGMLISRTSLHVFGIDCAKAFLLKMITIDLSVRVAKQNSSHQDINTVVHSVVFKNCFNWLSVTGPIRLFCLFLKILMYRKCPMYSNCLK
jgi:hypothetical protein